MPFCCQQARRAWEQLSNTQTALKGQCSAAVLVEKQDSCDGFPNGTATPLQYKELGVHLGGFRLKEVELCCES